ncbi:hypothetical protein Holit_01551 [Hollandina sp. SP2]
MKHPYGISTIIGTGIILCMISCGSTPPSSVPDPQEETPSNEIRQALTDAQERVKNLRKLAGDFEGPLYYPDEWNSAESRYAQAEALKPGSPQEYQEAIEKYTALGDTYNEIGIKAIPQYRETRNQAVQSAREGAVEAGAVEWLPEPLDKADKTAAEALRLYDVQDYYAFARESAATEALYILLKTEAASMGIRSEIETHNLSRFDPQRFAAAEEQLQQAVSAYEGQDIAAAQQAAAEALVQYQQVADTGWEALAEEQRQRVRALREEALNLKAHIAMKDAYQEADMVYTEGERIINAKNYKQALALFTQGVDLFTAVRDTTAKKRQTAEKAIQTAQDKIADSDKRAKSAQAKLGGIR